MRNILIASQQMDKIELLIENYWRKRNFAIINNTHDLFEIIDNNFQNYFDVSTEKFLYRGQENIQYGFTSSLYRLLFSENGNNPIISEDQMRKSERMLIDEMIKQGLGRNMTKGQLLMVLQHYGIPTRLIDVSRTALEALYFAVESQDQRDGVLFIIDAYGEACDGKKGNKDIGLKLHSGDGISFNHVKDKELSLPWWNWNTKPGGEKLWNNQVRVIDHLSLDPRMHAQNGVFLAGGLNRRLSRISYQEDSGEIEYETDQPTFTEPAHTQLSSLTINWLKDTRKRSSRAGMETTGWNLIIPGKIKPEVRMELDKRGINANTIYPGFHEVQRLSRYVAINSVK